MALEINGVHHSLLDIGANHDAAVTTHQRCIILAESTREILAHFHIGDEETRVPEGGAAGPDRNMRAGTAGGMHAGAQRLARETKRDDFVGMVVNDGYDVGAGLVD